MAIEFVKCRRVDDPARVADIAVSALPHLTGWEPIPEEELRAEREAEAARVSESAGVEVTKQPPAPEPADTDPSPAPDPKPEPEEGDTPARPTTRKSRSRAATEE
jgi:hypothetical protein